MSNKKDDENPFESPQTTDTAVSPSRSTVGSTILLIVLSILSLFAGVIVFFVVCYGTGMLGVSMLEGGGPDFYVSAQLIVLLAVLIGAACGIGTSFLLMRWIYKARLKAKEKLIESMAVGEMKRSD